MSRAEKAFGGLVFILMLVFIIIFGMVISDGVKNYKECGLFTIPCINNHSLQLEIR